MAQIYSTRADTESIMGLAGVLACIDDDGDGVESAEETQYEVDARERAAVEMNGSLRNQYTLSELATNDWCKWCNAYLACDYLASRRNNPPAPSVLSKVEMYRNNLEEAKWGRFQIPEQAPSFEHIMTVSNFTPELGKVDNPIRVVVEESTGASPGGNRKRNVAKQGGWW